MASNRAAAPCLRATRPDRPDRSAKPAGREALTAAPAPGREARDESDIAECGAGVKPKVIESRLRQVGWQGQTGAIYGLYERPQNHEPGSFAPLYAIVDADRWDPPGT
jgi:hypothetical protein